MCVCLHTVCPQVTIIDTGVRGMIAVGLVPQHYKLDHQPGWLPQSVAYHADDGKYVTPIHTVSHSLYKGTDFVWVQQDTARS